jgi:glutamyl-tRNA synthetase
MTRACPPYGVFGGGVAPSLLREFILRQGPSQNIVNMDWTQFWGVNKKYIDPVAARYTAIPKLDVVTAYIDGVGETTSAQRPKHKNPGLGTKEVIFANEVLIAQDDARLVKDGEVITLMN